jgi:putative dimethyl sulfoxide reductase chaperone
MDAATRASARAAGLRLLASAFDAAPSGDDLATLTELSRLPAQDEEAVAEEHCAVFDRDVVPLAGLFLDPEGRGGGPLVTHLVTHFASLGAPAPPTPESLSAQLRGLAWLCSAESEAQRDGQAEEIVRMRGMQRRWLDAVLLPWMPAFVAAVSRTGRTWATALAGETLDLLLQLRDELGPGEEPELPPAPETPDLDDVSTDIRAVARWLSTPAASGLFLGRHVLERLGRTSDVPRGFGGRQLMLGNLLRAAARFDALENVLDGLTAEVAAWRQELPEGGVGAPWQRRLDQTTVVLQRLREAG